MSDANKAIIRRLFDECLNSHDLALYPKLYTNVIYDVARVLYRRDSTKLQKLRYIV